MSDLALSIMQPWCWLIAAGFKDIENRTWSTRFRGRVLLHSGKKYDGDEGADWAWPSIERPEDFDMGGIIGDAEIVDCVTSSSSHWFYGPYGFVIRNARLLDFRPCRGALGFFRPDFNPPPPPAPKQGKARAQRDLF
jgi:hypothetical protein